MIEELTVETDGADDSGPHYERLRAWRMEQRAIITQAKGLRHKTGELYDPRGSELLRYLVEKLDPLFLAELALIAMRPNNRDFTNHNLLKFDADSRLWNGVTFEEHEQQKRARAAAREEAARQKELRQAERKAGKEKTRRGRGRVSTFGLTDFAGWWTMFYLETQCLPGVGELFDYITGPDQLNNGMSRRPFFRQMAIAREKGLFTDVQHPGNRRRVLILPGPNWSIGDADMPDGFEQESAIARTVAKDAAKPDAAAGDDNPAI